MTIIQAYLFISQTNL